MHVALAKAHAADDRVAGAPARRPARRALSRPPGDGARARRKSRTRRARSSTDATSSTSPSGRSCGRSTSRRKSEIAAAAKRVSLVTAISPRAILDVVFVVAQIVRLVRRIAEIYGGRPGLLRPHQARALDRRPYRHHWRHGGRRQPDAAAASATGSPRASQPAWAKACSMACSRRASACPRSPSAGPRHSRSTKPPASPKSRLSCSTRGSDIILPLRGIRGEACRGPGSARAMGLSLREHPMIAEISSHREELRGIVPPVPRAPP